ncbi:SRPBCC family protein [Micromonospora sp. FIMYZ51]|uniref:SRPBCC family protein n=1 Tax=Micromonospora sp. FIMYZ51 TaxID=3051832 RepID=UPI00311DFBBC
MAITVDRLIEADRAALWRVISDLDRWAEFLPTVDEIERLDGPGPITVGSSFRIRQPGLMAATYRITEWHPEADFTWVARSPGVRTTATHRLRPAGSAVSLQLGISWAGPGAALVRLLFGRRTRRFLDQEAAAFARLAEHRDS